MSEKVLTEQDKKVLNEIAKASWRHRKNAGGWVKVRSFNELEKYSPAVAKKLITPVIASRLATEKRCKLVPVRLKSESVGLKWLEDFCKERFTSYNQDINDLLCAVRAKAEDGK